MNRKLFILMAAASICTQAVILTAPKAASNVQKIETLDELDIYTADSDKPVVAYFTTDWCTFCKKMKPDLEKVQNDPAVAAKFNFVEIDGATFDGKKDLAIEGYPTLIIFKDGNEVSRFNGGNEAEIRTELRSV